MLGAGRTRGRTQRERRRADAVYPARLRALQAPHGGARRAAGRCRIEPAPPPKSAAMRRLQADTANSSRWPAGSGGGTVAARRRSAGKTPICGGAGGHLGAQNGRTAVRTWPNICRRKAAISGQEPELEEFLSGRRSPAGNRRPRRSAACATRTTAEGRAVMQSAGRRPHSSRFSARWSAMAWTISYAPRICTARFASCSFFPRGPGFNAAPA